VGYFRKYLGIRTERSADGHELRAAALSKENALSLALWVVDGLRERQSVGQILREQHAEKIPEKVPKNPGTFRRHSMRRLPPEFFSLSAVG
jgi:hypothetical protein